MALQLLVFILLFGSSLKLESVTGGKRIVVGNNNETNDRFAVLEFKKQIDLDPYGALSSWNNSIHFRTWVGIICSNRYRQRVINLDLQGKGLGGNISPSIGNLTFLHSLDLGNNSFHGKIPQEIGNLFRLQFIFFYNNTLEGEIPISLANCTRLREIHFPYNNLVGKIPVELFTSLSKLETISMQYNGLIGEIPASFANISSFRSIHLGGNELQGSIPESFGQLTNLNIFSLKENKLSGFGSFGSVYKGIIEQDETIVAIKVLNLQNPRGYKSFMAECKALINIRHRNIVKILTSCSSLDSKGKDFKALVYQFMPNGSVDDWLHLSVEAHNQSRNLSLLQRLNIAIDVASTLDYLHYHCYVPIVHCDLKPSNVLFNSDMTAQICDFGLAKLLVELDDNSSQTQTSTIGIKGSIGYVAPEYGMGGRATIQGDVFSYGILLLEIFIEKRPTDQMFKDDLNLHNFAKTSFRSNTSTQRRTK
ncbi:probable LRR receptor-like serine/threonine-protein kinase At3g47570 [Telopea speciosissima]|uniref:probable LRR receptor-like serine/threonine-protein kinase At3g47570 n=1 Tax=Telopea speciosissima TaxID=54955 RepID=UPI001CC64821|nr:probable LRR receptor-like serine/threonine-protein kinase At3g47570 [Telopea speciosissima]